MSIYDGMLPEKEIKGKLGFYPVTSKEEWESLPALYKVMDWEPVKDPFDGGKLKAVKNVIFDVVYMEPYGIRATVSVHPQEIQSILFCLHKEKDCQLYTIREVELEGGLRLGAHWLQDTTTGAFAIVLNGGGSTVARQGGYMGYIPGRIKKTELGKFEYDLYYHGDKTGFYHYLNPFRNVKDPEVKKETDVIKNLMDAVAEYGQEAAWSDNDIIDTLVSCGITQEDFRKYGKEDFVKEYFEEEMLKEKPVELESIIDLEIREKYEKETGNIWGNTEERMAEICSFYGYGFSWNKKGNIAINNGYYEGLFEDIGYEIYQFYGKNFEKDVDGDILKHYEYESAESMIQDWLDICKESNQDYIKNGQEKPFPWADEEKVEIKEKNRQEEKKSLDEKIAGVDDKVFLRQGNALPKIKNNEKDLVEL